MAEGCILSTNPNSSVLKRFTLPSKQRVLWSNKCWELWVHSNVSLEQGFSEHSMRCALWPWQRNAKPDSFDLAGQECQEHIIVFAGLGGPESLEAGRGRNAEGNTRKKRVTEAEGEIRVLEAAAHHGCQGSGQVQEDASSQGGFLHLAMLKVIITFTRAVSVEWWERNQSTLSRRSDRESCGRGEWVSDPSTVRHLAVRLETGVCGGSRVAGRVLVCFTYCGRRDT